MPPEVLLVGVSWDSLLLGEVLALCFLFLLLWPVPGLPLLGLLLFLVPEVIPPGVVLPFCRQSMHINVLLVDNHYNHRDASGFWHQCMQLGPAALPIAVWHASAALRMVSASEPAAKAALSSAS